SRRTPEKLALVWDGGALTFGELDRRANAFAEIVAAGGVKPGDRIALSIGNHWAFAVALIAGWKLGVTVAPLDKLLKEDERADILADLSPAVLIDETHVEGSVERVPSSQRRGNPKLAAALILYTSGSTGRPKGAVLSHAALEAAIESWAGPVMALTPDDVVLATLPLAHSFGLNGALLAPLLVGATVALVERFAPDRVIEAIRRHRVTVFPGVATMFRRLLDAPVLVDEWFRTGDLATVDDDGLVTIVGRKRERILRGGYSVFPPEVEAVLLAHPAVAEAAVLGMPHPELGEDIAAFVALRPDSAATADELIAHCRNRLAAFKYPRRLIVLDALPKSPTGKSLKSRLPL